MKVYTKLAAYFRRFQLHLIFTSGQRFGFVYFRGKAVLEKLLSGVKMILSRKQITVCINVYLQLMRNNNSMEKSIMYVGFRLVS